LLLVCVSGRLEFASLTTALACHFFLRQLLREVTRGEGADAVRLVVADVTSDAAVDRRVASRLRVTGLIDRHVMLYHARMVDEPMLWCADAVSWSAFRNLAVDDDRWVAPLFPVLSVFDASTGWRLEMKRPQAAYALGAEAAPPPGVQFAVGSGSGAQAVASIVDYTGGLVPSQSFSRGSTVLNDLVRQIEVVRREAGVQGVVDGNTPAALKARRRLVDVQDLPEWAQPVFGGIVAR